MNKRDFVKQRQPRWRRFEQLAERIERTRLKSLSGREINEFSRLFREISNDLAVVRSRSWGERLASYLNHLVSRGHNGFYRTPPARMSRFLRFLAVGYPRVFRRNIGCFLTACALFFVPYAITWILVQSDPARGARIVPQPMLDFYAQMYEFEPDDPRRRAVSEMQNLMGGFYIQHNTNIALISFAGGIFFGFFSVYTLLSNGIVLGAVSGYVISQGHGKAFTSFIVSHGSFELTGIAVAGGAGLLLGNALLHPGERTRLQSLRVRGLEAVQIAAGAAVMIGVAALIEAFWSPSGVPSILKYVVGAILWVLVILYLALAGREVREEGE